MRIRIRMLACESLGVRSIATLIELGDLKIVVDPGLSLGSRYGMIPHPLEYKRLLELRHRLFKVLEKADVIIISHYHYDHYLRLDRVDYIWTWSIPKENIKAYESKELILVKDVNRMINVSQKIRGMKLWRKLEEEKLHFEPADLKSFEIGDVKIEFPIVAPHGPENTKLGYVLITVIEHGNIKIVHASDIQALSNNTVKSIISLKPDILIISGPPLYLEGSKVSSNLISVGLENLYKLAGSCRILIVDHHFARDIRCLEHVKNIRDRELNAYLGCEWEGVEPMLLEYQRQKLYEKYPPNKEFISWINMGKEKMRITPPPIGDYHD